MTKLFWYKITSIALLMLNISILVFFYFSRPSMGMPPPPMDGRAENPRKVAQILHLDSEQEEKFVQLAISHRKSLQKLTEEQYDILGPAFLVISSEESHNVQLRDSVLEPVQLLEKEKIQATYDHFKEVKKLLREEQLVYFQEFMDLILSTTFKKSKKR
ncbi:MAG: hypothetical protein MRZ79_21610 [Bacteroidia bacterium]|nr:hypothetical protein [Bacteroidia bacterium]